MSRAIVNVATTDYTRRGQNRLREALLIHSPESWLALHEQLPSGSPSHQLVPYAFKVYALEATRRAARLDSLLWCDSCILPVRSLEPAWEKIERDGYLLMNNGFSNYEWTADSAYPELFRDHEGNRFDIGNQHCMNAARQMNRKIPHVVGGFFGLSMKHEIGRAFLAELYRLASETRAFCGPWSNWNHEYNEDTNAFVGAEWKGQHTYPCGPPDVRGHRHDQSAMSVIAWRLGMVLTDCPQYLIYGKAEDSVDPRTCVVADGSYA